MFDTLKDFLGRGQVEGINNTSLALLTSSINKNVSLKVMTCTKSSYILLFVDKCVYNISSCICTQQIYLYMSVLKILFRMHCIYHHYDIVL